MKNLNLYEILQAKPTFSQKQLKDAYHKQLKIYSPIFSRIRNNQNEQACKLRYNQILNAYRILSNKNTRYVYDLLGPNQSNLLLNDLSSKIITSLINKQNISLLVFSFLVLILIIFTTQPFIFLNQTNQTNYFLSKINRHQIGKVILLHTSVSSLLILLVVIRIMRSFKKMDSPLPRTVLLPIVIVIGIALLQALLLCLKLDLQIRLPWVLVCLPILVVDLAFHFLLCLRQNKKKKKRKSRNENQNNSNKENDGNNLNYENENNSNNENISDNLNYENENQNNLNNNSNQNSNSNNQNINNSNQNNNSHNQNINNSNQNNSNDTRIDINKNNTLHTVLLPILCTIFPVLLHVLVINFMTRVTVPFRAILCIVPLVQYLIGKYFSLCTCLILTIVITLVWLPYVLFHYIGLTWLTISSNVLVLLMVMVTHYFIVKQIRSVHAYEIIRQKRYLTA